MRKPNKSSPKRQAGRQRQHLKPLSRLDDCGPLLREIRQARKHERWATKTYLDLILGCGGDFDIAMILSQAVYWDDPDSEGKRRARYTAKDCEGEVLADEDGSPIVVGWLVDKDDPGATLGIPWKRFWRLVDKLVKAKILRRDPAWRWKASPMGAANTVWKRREGHCVITLIGRDKIEDALQGETISMPWAWRAAMSQRKTPPKTKHWNRGQGASVKAKAMRDIEDGNGAHLTLLLMKRQTMNPTTNKPNCNRQHDGHYWSGDTREAWAETLRLRNVWRFDRLVREMPALIKRRQGWFNGNLPGKRVQEKHWQELQLRPILENLVSRWKKRGKPFQKKMKGYVRGQNP